MAEMCGWNGECGWERAGTGRGVAGRGVARVRE